MSLFSILDVSASALAAQRMRVDVLAQNIANAETTRTPEGGPYRRRHVVFKAEPQLVSGFQAVLARVQSPSGSSLPPDVQGVRVAEVSVDNTPAERRYLPSHPDANAEGYVDFPPFNPVEDMVDLTAAVRSYQANLAVVSADRGAITQPKPPSGAVQAPSAAKVA